jgi:hypothetical protein
MTGASSGSEVDELVRARSGVAGLELIAEYYDEGEAHDR